jgi:hypothetical protein
MKRVVVVVVRVDGCIGAVCQKNLRKSPATFEEKNFGMTAGTASHAIATPKVAPYRHRGGVSMGSSECSAELSVSSVLGRDSCDDVVVSPSKRESEI